MHCRLRVSLLRSDAELRRRSLPARYTRCTLRIFAQPPHRTRSPLSVAQKVLNLAGKGGYGSPSVFFDVVERIRAYRAFVASVFSVKRKLGDLATGLWKNFRIFCFCHSILGSVRVRGSRNWSRKGFLRFMFRTLCCLVQSRLDDLELIFRILWKYLFGCDLKRLAYFFISDTVSSRSTLMDLEIDLWKESCVPCFFRFVSAFEAREMI